MGKHDEAALARGIAALYDVVGGEAAASLLQCAPTVRGEVASFYLPLPVDHTGITRRLRIGFPTRFPRAPLNLTVDPSPWLVWPHAMPTRLCLHGMRERPITGSPEYVVQDSLARVAKVMSFAREDTDPALREAEFQKEITAYWSMQLSGAGQPLLLLDRPAAACALFALSDPRLRAGVSPDTLWLASTPSMLAQHYQHVVGRRVNVRAAQCPGFYVTLRDHPARRLPAPSGVLAWLLPHLTPADAHALSTWFHASGSLPHRWIVLALPGEAPAACYCLEVRACGEQVHAGRFYLRTSRRQPARACHAPPTQLRAARLDVLDRTTLFSRDQSGAPQVLAQARVVCVGVGSLGSQVAWQLARAGVGHLTLIDPDTLEAANVGRHVLGASDLGRTKVDALREALCKALPTVQISAHATFMEWVMVDTPAVFDQADLVIVTTADWQSESILWRVKATGKAWGLLQAWSEPHTVAGHVLFAPAGAFDAQYLFRENGAFRHAFTAWPNDGVVPLPGCGESFIPGGSLGMMPIATTVSRMALRALQRTLCTPTWASDIDTPDEVAALGGTYHGPALPAGMQQAQFVRAWPAAQVAP